MQLTDDDRSDGDDHEVRAPRPRPGSPELHLTERTSLTRPSPPELPASKADRYPCDLQQAYEVRFIVCSGSRVGKQTHLIGDPDDILQPAPQLTAADEARAEAEDTDTTCRQEGEERNARRRRPGEDGRCLWGVRHGEPIQHTRASKQGVVARGEHRREDDGVHK